MCLWVKKLFCAHLYKQLTFFKVVSGEEWTQIRLPNSHLLSDTASCLWQKWGKKKKYIYIYIYIPVKGRGGHWGWEMLRISHCIDNRITDGGKFVSLTHRPRSNNQKHYCSASGIHFCHRLSGCQDVVLPEGLGKLKQFTSSGLEPETSMLVA
jgi:hypothetical protein